MDDIFGGLVRTIGDGISGLLSGAFDAIGAAVREIVGIFSGFLPGVWLPVVVVAVLLIVGWNLAKR